MKRLLFIPMACAAMLSLVAVSCRVEEEIEQNQAGSSSQSGATVSGDSTSTQPKPHEPAIEIVSAYTEEDYARPVDGESDDDFTDGSEEEAIAMGDTLKSSEMIPFVAEVSESITIFADGTSESVRSVVLDTAENPMLWLRKDIEQMLPRLISRVEVKDGWSCAYNQAGELLYCNEMEMPDFSDLLEEYAAAKAAAEEGEEAVTKSGVKAGRDAAWLRAQMAAHFPETRSGVSSWSVSERADGRVVLEQRVGGADTRSQAGEVTVRTVFSADISRVYGYDQLEGGRLMVRCTNTYAERSGASTRGGVVLAPGVGGEVPVRTVTQSRSTLSDGRPSIRVSSRTYRVNQVKFNLK